MLVIEVSVANFPADARCVLRGNSRSRVASSDLGVRSEGSGGWSMARRLDSNPGTLADLLGWFGVIRESYQVVQGTKMEVYA